MSTVTPILGYRDPRAAIDFLCDAFGFERRLVVDGDDGGVAHAELRLGDSVVMVATAPGPGGGRPEIAPGAHHCYVVVPDADAHHARATAAGARVFEGLTDRDYGSREYGASDPEGGTWYFGTYVPVASSS
jgi:uncharacterized glyoxalase superfamily protein PhnB